MTKLFWMTALVLLLAGTLLADSPSPFILAQSFNGSGGYNGVNFSLMQPMGLAWGKNSIYVGDDTRNKVIVFDLNDNVVNEIGGAGADINTPVALFWTPWALYISDTDKGGVIAYYGTTSSRVGPTVSAHHWPSGIWVENQTLWMLDSQDGTLLQYNTTTNAIGGTYFGKGFGSMQLSNPQDIAMDANNVYIADTGNNRLQVYDRKLNFVDSWGTGRGGVSLLEPTSVATDGTHVYVADKGNNRIVVFGTDGYPLLTEGPALSDNTSLSDPSTVRLGDGGLFVLDTGNKRVVYFALNWSNSQPQLLADLDTTNRSVQNYYTSVITVMDKLNVSHAPFDLPAKLTNAYAMVQAGQYSQASSILSDVRASLSALTLVQVQALRTALQMRIDHISSALQYYHDMPQTGAQAAAQSTILNQIDDGQHLLNNGQYADAASVLLPLDAQLAAYRQSMDSSISGQNNTQKPVAQSPQQLVLLAQAGNLSEQLSALQAQMTRLHQNASLSTLAGLIASGQQLAQSGDYSNANASLTAAAAQLANLAPALQAQQQAVDNASAAIAKGWSEVNSSQQAWGVMGIDTQPIVDQLTQAQNMLYDQPGQAQQLAEQAQAAAELQNARVQQRGAAIGWVGLALVGVLALGIAALILLRTRAPTGGGSWKDWMERRVRRANVKEKLDEEMQQLRGPKKRGL